MRNEQNEDFIVVRVCDCLFGRQDKIGIAFDLTFQRRLVTGEVEKFENIAPQS